MAKHRLTDDQAAAEIAVAALDKHFKTRGIDKQIRALMTQQGREDLDRTVRDHARRAGR
ncbi:hypothetical protein AB0J80_13395 [Actinoplanes sp. NPDC049548]|uniref:hypothetical protein n=1 Tax=Actinoplanes sp. NPDC049548 TaxID=3155152 RepID=UPI003449F642